MTRSPFRRAAAQRPRTGRLASAAVFVAGTAVAAGIVVGGTVAIGARAQARDVPAPALPTPVVAVEVTLEPGYPVMRGYAARLEAARRSELAFESAGTLVEVRADEGGAVSGGDVVARLDARELEAERDRLRAARRALDADAELARLNLERQERLRERGFAPDEALDDARLSVDRIVAGIAEAEAGLALVGVRIDKTLLRAPFDGTVAERHLDEGATVSPGQAVLVLDERAAPRLRVGLPPERARELDASLAYRFVATNARGRDGAPVALSARLASVRRDVDARTRTVSATFEPEPDAALPFVGDLLELRFDEMVSADVYEVPVAALVEAERGLWSVLALETSPDVEVDPLVRRVPVRVRHVAGERAWIEAPLGASATLVAGGRHRVVPGMRVRAVGASELAAAHADSEG